MRILVCSKRDLSAMVILNDLLDRLTRIPGVSLSLMLAERTRPVETVVPELIRMKALERDLPFGVLFPLVDGGSATGAGAERALRAIVGPTELAAALASPSTAFAGKTLLTLNHLLERHDISCMVVRGLKDPAVLAAVGGFAPDLILSVRFSFLLSPAFLAPARLGAINVHPGRLPDYAGLYPHFYSLLAGERSTGCTVHQVDEGIDSGPVLAAGEVAIVPGRSAFAINLDSHLLGNRLVVEIIERLADGGRLVGRPHDGRPPSQHTYPTPQQFRDFQMKGLSLIDLREYVGILQRFGVFGEPLIMTNAGELPQSGVSVKLKSAERG